jgi:glycerol uptake facilitator-like aquaporin
MMSLIIAAVLYMIAQTCGSALAGGLLFGVWGHARAIEYHGGGCFFDSAPPGRVFLNEAVCSFINLYLAFGVGLDPRQAALFGPKLGPLMVGSALGLVAFASSGAMPGSMGAQMNPARCFAYAIARQDMHGQWIWWFGPAVGAVLLAALYNSIPPHFAAREQRAIRSQT